MLNATEEQKRSLRRIRIAIIVMFAICAALAIFVYWQGLPPPAHLYDALAKCIAQSEHHILWRVLVPALRRAERPSSALARNIFPTWNARSTGTSGGETQVCIDHNITQYPTWVFADGSRLVGVQTPQTLATKTGCAL